VPALPIAPVPASLSLAAVNSAPQSFAGPFITSSGESILFIRQKSQWQAVFQGEAGTMTHKRTLPVVSSGDIGASIEALQDQDVWSSRSHIHVLSAPHKLPTSCVYVGKLSLLGGAPTQQAQSPSEECCSCPIMILCSNAPSKEVYHIPPGYRYKGYRLQEGSGIQRARLTVRDVGGEGLPLQHTEHVGLVLCDSTKKAKECCEEHNIDVQVEIFVEKIEEVSSIQHATAGKFAPDQQIHNPDVRLKRSLTEDFSFDTTAWSQYCGKVGAAPSLTEDFSFGTAAWSQYFGEVGAAPSLPSDVGEILHSPCPFWKGKEVKDTHLLVLIPLYSRWRSF
jgi:hypothetical protein